MLPPQGEFILVSGISLYPTKKQRKRFGDKAIRHLFLAVIRDLKEIPLLIELFYYQGIKPKNMLRVYYIPHEDELPMEIYYKKIYVNEKGQTLFGDYEFLGWLV